MSKIAALYPPSIVPGAQPFSTFRFSNPGHVTELLHIVSAALKLSYMETQFLIYLVENDVDPLVSTFVVRNRDNLPTLNSIGFSSMPVHRELFRFSCQVWATVGIGLTRATLPSQSLISLSKLVLIRKASVVHVPLRDDSLMFVPISGLIMVVSSQKNSIQAHIWRSQSGSPSMNR